jgi:hypothetical protein
VDREKLEELWLAEGRAALKAFIQKNIGFTLDAQTGESRPACFGSGDGQTYCKVCAYLSRC